MTVLSRLMLAWAEDPPLAEALVIAMALAVIVLAGSASGETM